MRKPSMVCILFFVIAVPLPLAHADFQTTLPEGFVLNPGSNQRQKSIPSLQTGWMDQENSKTEKKPKQVMKSNESNGLDQDLSQHKSDAPVFFRGKRAFGSQKTGILNLEENVVIIQDDTTLNSDKAQLFATPGGVPGPFSGSKSAQVQKAVATGNVHIYKKPVNQSPEIKASGEKVEFFVASRTVILSGKAKVWRGEEYLNAEIIHLNLNTGDVFLSTPKGTVNPESLDKKIK